MDKALEAFQHEALKLVEQGSFGEALRVLGVVLDAQAFGFPVGSPEFRTRSELSSTLLACADIVASTEAARQNSK